MQTLQHSKGPKVSAYLRLVDEKERLKSALAGLIEQVELDKHI
jgi:hypothetical protein